MSFLRNENGGIAIVFCISTMVLVMCCGAAIDYSRWMHVRQETQQSLDAAVLAGARAYQMSTDLVAAKSTAMALFTDQVTNRLAVTDASVNFDLVDQSSGFEGTAHARVATPLMGMGSVSGVGVSSLPVSAISLVRFSAGGSAEASDLEISLMLDMTGSMCTDGQGPCQSSAKLDALKSAAQDLVNIVVRQGAGQQVTKVAVVPFSTRVRVGVGLTAQANSLMKSLTNVDSLWSGWYNDCTQSTGSNASEGSGNWSCQNYQSTQVTWHLMPCVTDRTGPQQFTDAAPGPDAWLNTHDGHRFPLSDDSLDVPLTSELGLVQSDPADHWSFRANAYCADVDESNQVVPLTSDKPTLISHIEGLEAYGATAGALGTAWSWYVLSPNWSGIWSGEGTPGPYSDLSVINAGGQPKLRKIAVMMTDGQYNTYRSWKDHDPDAVSNNAKAICTNMKAQGIEIYTVGFDLDALPIADRDRAIDTLQSCGTDVSHFYNTIDASQLKQAFHAIALQLSSLYLAK